MLLDPEVLKKIIKRRDRRYDGRFFFGVKTTRIYCRPVCPAKPKAENIVIFRSMAEAENSGYRPCKRCRPELAPGHPLIVGTGNTVSRALKIIAQDTGGTFSIESLSDTLGVTSRHLRRLFDEHLGASPIDIVSTQRIHFAHQLLESSQLSMTDIAFASGYKSIRRFNEAFKTHYRCAPSEVRKTNQTHDSAEILLSLPVQQPYDWSYVLSYLKRHETFGAEIVGAADYCRFVPLANADVGYGTLRVTYDGKQSVLNIRTKNIPLVSIRGYLTRLRNLFDTEHNPSHLPGKGTLAGAGIRVPGCFEPFETAVAIILGQLVSTVQARAKLKDFIKKFGRKIENDERVEVLEFPSPFIVKTAPVESIGVTRAKSQTIRDLARAIDEGHISFSAISDPQQTVARLSSIKGIGPWTANMIAMRCLGDPDAFPEKDLIVLRAYERQLFDPVEWSSSRAYLTHCLWRDFAESLSLANKKRPKPTQRK